jgi:tetratricopeptide (TPR) repeat protein
MEQIQLDDITTYNRIITTNASQSQIFCNKGLIQLFGLCYPEAIRLFKKALEYDENTPFALWGISYSYGPGINYNNLPEEYYKKGYEAYLKALEKIEYANECEKDLINSLKYRYPEKIPTTFEEKIQVIRNYRNEFRKIYEKYPNDLDIIAFYVEAIISIHRTMLWNLDKSPTPEVLEAMEILEKALKQGYHPHLCHLKIHTLERHPINYKGALKSAELLAENVRGIGHLLHMPSHIFIKYGRYKECIELGKRSVKANYNIYNIIGKYELYTLNILHDIFYVVYSSMFAGHYDTALKYSIIIKEEIDEKLIDMFFPIVEWYYPSYFHVYIRFGKWDEILAEKIIESEKYPITKTIQRYARSIAYAVKGDVDNSEKEFEYFKKERENLPEVSVIGNNPAQVVFEIANQMALGEILYRKKDYDNAFQHLRESVKLCDNLKFSEPWDWMQPPRHALGALLLEQNYLEESVKVYNRDLVTYPDNIWSLIGLEECYIKMIIRSDITNSIQEVEKELKTVQEKLSKAREEIGMNIKASCYCKKVT